MSGVELNEIGTIIYDESLLPDKFSIFFYPCPLKEKILKTIV